jgi:hypothetical protein
MDGWDEMRDEGILITGVLVCGFPPFTWVRLGFLI